MLSRSRLPAAGREDLDVDRADFWRRVDALAEIVQLRHARQADAQFLRDRQQPLYFVAVDDRLGVDQELRFSALAA